MKRCSFLVCLTFFLLCAVLIDVSQAAIRSQNTQLQPQAAYNPHADPKDILIPMPCDLFQVFRTVAVSGGVKNDMKFLMGVKEIEERRQIFESSMETHIAAPFTVADLPADWKGKLDVEKPDSFSYYFLGKYEVSQLQWDVIMNVLSDDGTVNEAMCPKSVSLKDTYPVSNISWAQVQHFLQRYNAWLIKTKPNSLPSYAGTNNIGFMRLPTEEEWEFAARGGIKVRREDRDNNDTFLSSDTDLHAYAVFRSEKSGVQESPSAIGSRRPNPLMLYDTMGNVSEMIDGFFHVTISEIAVNSQQNTRLHGATGGLICKGGSFRGEKSGILPGCRDEFPLYTKKGEYRAKELGFRLALAGMVTPNASRLTALQNRKIGVEERLVQRKTEAPLAQREGSREQVITLSKNGDVLGELGRIQAVTKSEEVQKNLEQLRTLLANREAAVERQRIVFLEDIMRSSLYQAETIRAYAFRYVSVRKLLDEAIHANKLSEENKEAGNAKLQEYYLNLLTQANQYKNHLRKIAVAEPSLVAEIQAQLSAEYSGGGSLNRHMQENLKTLTNHLAFAKKYNFEKLTGKQICRDIIPKTHLDKMQHFK